MPTYSQETINEISKQLIKNLWPTIVFIVALIVVGVLGNLLVFCVYLKRFRPSAARVFILAMSVCDLLSNLISLPLTIFHLKHFYNSVDNPTCKVIQASWRFPTIMSLLLLVCVAIDRHRRICFPFKRQITHRPAILMLMIPFIVSVLLTSPFVVISGQNRREYAGFVTCSVKDEYLLSPWRTSTGILFMLFFLLALAILIVCYVHIVCKVQQLKMNRQRIGISQLNKYDPGQQSMFNQVSSDCRKMSPACSSEMNSDPEKDDSEILARSKTASETVAETTETSLKPLSNEPLAHQLPVTSHVSSPVIVTNAPLQQSKSITSSHQGSEPMPGNLQTLRLTEEKAKTEVKSSLARKDLGRKQTRFSKTTLMMLVLTLTTIVLFVPHIILVIQKDGCLGHENVVKMNICAVALLFPYLNSVINPFIYSFCNPKFRLQCRLFLRSLYDWFHTCIVNTFIGCFSAT